MKRKSILLPLIALGLFIRLFLIPNPGFEADVSFWKSWGLATVDFGIVEGIKITNNNYPTPFAYTLGAMVWIYQIFADPHNFNEFWKNTNLLFLAISKSLPILADFGIAGILLYIGKHAKRLGFPDVIFSFFGLSFYQLLAIIYLLSPLSLIDGALWGQVDSLGVFTFLLALLALLKRWPFLAGVLYMVAMMTKLQNMIYGPLFFLFLWQTVGFNGLIQAIGGALIGFFGLNIEFVLSHNMDRVFASLTENYDYFPWMSLMAYNLWWIVTGARGMMTSDKLTVLGLLNAKTVGLLLFSSFYLFAVVRQLFISLRVTLARAPTDTRSPANLNISSEVSPEGNFGQKKNILRNHSGRTRIDQWDTREAGPAVLLKSFLESLVIVNAAFFLFQTQSHDRYAFPLTVFLLLWIPFVLSWPSHPTRIVKLLYCSIAKKTSATIQQYNNITMFLVFYTLFTFFYFYNLHTALIVNYPNNGLPILSSLMQPFFTIGTAFVLLSLFGIFLFTLVRSSRSSRVIAIVVSIIFVVSLSAMNYPLFTKRPIPLGRFTPYISEQAYGTRQTDRAVQSSFGGPYKWTRLSVQYLFYKKGIGTHANSKHVFDINRKFTKFTTDYGIDTEAGTKASAIFSIYGDGRLLFRSDKTGRFDLPRHAEVNITGVKYLILVTTDADDGNYDDHTDWLNPILWP